MQTLYWNVAEMVSRYQYLNRKILLERQCVVSANQLKPRNIHNYYEILISEHTFQQGVFYGLNWSRSLCDI